MVIYFITGLIQNLLATLGFKAAQHNKYLLASGLTFLIMFLGYYIIAEIVVAADSYPLLVFSLGNAAGCYLGMKLFSKIKI
jgi:hypothetical protein